MFTSHWWSSVVRSDEGFSVKFLSRETLRYTEGALCLELFYEAARGSASVSGSPDPCDPWLDAALPPEETRRVVTNVVRALESKGWVVDVIGGMDRVGTPRA